MSVNIESEKWYVDLSLKLKEDLSLIYKQDDFTYQESRILAEIASDIYMWEEGSIGKWWEEAKVKHASLEDKNYTKKIRLKFIKNKYKNLKDSPKSYKEVDFKFKRQNKLNIIKSRLDKKVYGDCPVCSDRTVCCGLKVIDAVENCSFGCSYCTIQTFYGDSVRFDENFREKLLSIEIDPSLFYHFGSGQSSDSLVWGNRNGVLDSLFEFAIMHPNILLEFKTKSANIKYFLDNKVPSNIVCSWSLNPKVIIDNEEHFTAPLEERLEAARKVANKGVRVAFHFHPIIYYDNWEKDYLDLSNKVQESFLPSEVAFISFGSLTFIKPVIRAIREKNIKSKILQMEMVPDPHGKLTYPDHIKTMKFKKMYESFKKWHEEVYFYLCMEKDYIWDEVFGWHYSSVKEFLEDFDAKVMPKLKNLY